MSYFRNDNALSEIIKKIYTTYMEAQASNNIHSNVIDPFSALLESSFSKMTYDEKGKVKREDLLSCEDYE